MKRIGFLSFGHWTPEPYLNVRTASNALLQSIELAVVAEELGLDGAYFRVHHFTRQLGSPFPLLAAVGARTKKIEIGTAASTCATKTPSTWPRMLAPRTSSLVGVCNWASAAAHGTGDRRLAVVRLCAA